MTFIIIVIMVFKTAILLHGDRKKVAQHHKGAI